MANPIGRQFRLALALLVLVWMALNAVVWAIDSAATSRSIGHVRAVMSGQVRFSRLAGGKYAGSLACLAGTERCIDGYVPEPGVSSLHRSDGIQFVTSASSGDQRVVDNFAFLSDPSGTRSWIAHATLVDGPASYCTDSTLGIYRVGAGTRLVSPSCPGDRIG